MPYIRIWIHLVWATKDRQPYLTEGIRKSVFRHIAENAKAKSIHLDHINGYLEHVHYLISLNADQNIATVAQLLKGESSFWVNKNKLSQERFGWQDEYFAASVSHSQIDVVRNYLRNQEEHHKKKSFQMEFDDFIDKYGFEKG